MLFAILISFFLAIATCNAVEHLYIIVPGTWSTEEGWHTPGGDFYEEMAASISQPPLSFFWSGRNNDKSRKIAAQKLAQQLDSYSPYTSIVLVCFSHGGNVANLATHYMKRSSITGIILLGTPIHEDYYPAFDKIDFCVNLFSLSDFIQPVLGHFGRMLPNHENVSNCMITIEGKEPDHYNLHHPIIARWITFLPDSVELEACGKLAFTATNLPHFTRINYYHKLMQEDSLLIARMHTTFWRRLIDNDYSGKKYFNK